MKKITRLMTPVVAILIAVGLFSCKKESVSDNFQQPPMQYTDHQDKLIGFSNPGSIDVDRDGNKDFVFEVLLVGDPVLQRDRRQFYIISRIHTALLNDDMDRSPALDQGSFILPAHIGYDWWEISAVVLAEKISPAQGPEVWDGNWKNAVRKNLPFRLARNNQFYYGWIEMTMDIQAEKLVIHRSGLSSIAGARVRAGM
jgi:hypothetical protein